MSLLGISVNATTSLPKGISLLLFNMDNLNPAASVFLRATETAAFLRTELPLSLQHPKVAIVCGSGLGGLAETIHPQPRLEMTYASIPNFPLSTGM